ncbi:coenzyme F420-0:L-glutamate ligase [Candidatus Daviesbacteria bacterium]|nr:coenzyme F420-0:L-glutamate ligase [Candidatus Daviesbacteria bacterium]
MKLTPIKTHKITKEDKDILKILDKYIVSMKENSVLAITSKIVAVCEGRVVEISKTNRDELVEKEAEIYLSPRENKYGFHITVKHNMLIASAGIDESNGNGYYVLWPKDPQQAANQIRQYLKARFSLTNVGVIITDSKTTPLRWGVTGIALSHSGFVALNTYVGKPDLFGRPLHVTKANAMDGLAASAVLVMGEGAEQTPMAIIEDVPFVEFQDRNPTQQELDMLKIEIDDDIYAPFLKNASWRRGKG